MKDFKKEATCDLASKKDQAVTTHLATNNGRGLEQQQLAVRGLKPDPGSVARAWLNQGNPGWNFGFHSQFIYLSD